MTRLPLVAVAACVLCSPPRLAAQPPSDPIPRNVVMAILRLSEGAESPVVEVTDRLPAQLAGRIALPPGARVLAVLTSDRVRVIGEARGTSDSIRTWFADEFERRGFTPLESGGSRQAFRVATRSASAPGYCGDGRLHTVSAHARARGMVEFAISIGDPARCAPRAAPSTYISGGSTSSSGVAPPALPLVYHPRGVEVSMECTDSRQRGGNLTMETAIASSSTAAQLLAHYGGQLESQGWTRQPWSAAVSSWARRDSTGREVSVTIGIDPGPGDTECRHLWMTTRGTR